MIFNSALRSFHRVVLICAGAALTLQAAEWPGFRGPNGSGVSDARGLPVEFGPDWNVAWKIEVPAGKSSPILVNGRIYLTGHDSNERLVLAYEVETGKLLWRRSVEQRRTESRNDLNDPAAPSPVSDGENVYAFFSEFGLISYGLDGQERWRIPLGPFDSEHGMSASPIVFDGKVILLVDQIGESYLAAFDAAEGRLRWKTDRPSLLGGYSTPVIYRPDGRAAEIIATSPTEVAGYSAENGEKLWWVSGLGYQPRSVPVVAGDTVYIHVHGFGGGPGAPFERVAKWLDKNEDGRIAMEELAGNPRNRFMPALVRRWGGEDNALNAEEWEQAQKSIQGPKSVLAVRLGGRGDLTEKDVLWRLTKSLPEVPSPLLYEGIFYLIRNGGIVTSIDPAGGEILKRGRVRDAIDQFYSSPIAADGKIYVASETGKVAVLKASAQWEALAVNDMEEEIYATPAVDDGHIYLRTQSTLYCFQESELVTGVRRGDRAAVEAVLAKGPQEPAVLAAALEIAEQGTRPEIAGLLREAGARPATATEDSAKFPLEFLERYAGEYETEQGWKSTIALEDGILLLNQWGQESKLNAVDEKTFRVDERIPITVTFELDGDRVTGYTDVREERTLVFKKVEAE